MTMHIIDDTSLGLVAGTTDTSQFRKRQTVRGVVFDLQGRVALLYAAQDGYHKLPGGGLKEGEDWRVAFERECLEEIGCKVIVRSTDLITVEERRQAESLIQISHCCIADVVEAGLSQQLDGHEVTFGLTPPKWLPIEEAIDLVMADRPQAYPCKFIQARDLLILKEAQCALQMSLPSH